MLILDSFDVHGSCSQVMLICPWTLNMVCVGDIR